MVYKALIIAVDQYNSVNDMPNTVNDALEIKRLLLESPSFFKEQDVQVFQGSISRRTILLSALKSFFETAVDTDILFLFWAGHGAFIDNEGYFVPFDGNIYSPNISMIKMSEVRDLIDQTPAKTILSFFDTCHSGTITRNIQQEMHRGLEVKGSGKVLIAACTASQYAADRAGHGAFTDYLIRGLEGEAADRNGDIDVYNLYSYVSKRLNEEIGGQNPVIKSTLNGEPLLLKRTINRSELTAVKTATNTIEQINSSGLSFWLGPIITDYDEFHSKNKGEYQITLINPDSKIEQALRDMRDRDRYPFAIRDEADIVSIENIDIKSTREGTYIVVNLKGTGERNNLIYSEMSIGGGMGKTLTPDDIAMLRIRRILFGEKVTPFGYGDSLVESMISHPTNAKIQVIPNIISSLASQGYTLEKIRVMIVGSLILTGTIDKIETLSLTLDNGVITKIHLIGYRPKYYSNVDPMKIEVNEAIDISI
ncbi:peptidase C14 [Bacillus canaveralius]|uniref:Peptidase C14 n=1 Tax=Bacillus canaveralius TaxID=1403243 RepID=A0A2N5GMZ0_9BACI|nr:caspase family protein [Bacillus canaveralius]PLR83477.1 peptidase C14 [Bacillus canaveralius]PLR95342.1 peptidase C14 [Bacillus canaveralius]